MERNEFANNLKAIRAELGHKSARAFFLKLSSQARLSFNYSYYMKMESGSTLPSVKIVNGLATLLTETQAERLIQAYCKVSFPRFTHLFHTHEKYSGLSAQKSSSPKVEYQMELSERQVACIAKSQKHYYFFLLCTLARKELGLKELNTYFSEEDLNTISEELVQEQILMQSKQQIKSAYPEWKFPAASTRSLKTLYSTLDEYDAQKNTFFKLEKVKRAELFRRVSPRYLDLVLQNFDLLLQVTRLADEIESKHNNEVVSLSMKIFRGTLPG